MKIISNIFSLVLLLVLFTGCGKDNYDAPESKLVGKVTYQGQALNLRGTGEAIQLQLYQDGYEKHDPISVFVGQEGEFSALLFNGEYKLVTRDGNGPWMNRHDTVTVNLNGHSEVNIEVTPYFMISNEQLAVSGTTMTASFTINQIVSTATINKVMLILSKTQFADDVNNVFRKDITEVSAGAVNLSADISDNAEIAKAKALYARVGVLANGADQAIYSTVVRLK
ncbi:hypothetical protein HMPREF1212_00829 [Parabacteroides sp. HGS0025]|uniref:DUF3823 domain-containing protein n=1 Tax=Parabacteroides sp. HGS0025 TaxID=1078087 RepID=UPI0006175B3A|nr:DUF3823 domain-containing protein [Parabacteroides sp. HGS0025]KKB52673.1 hypothetical protein HMPREF1212_00829 [Parabacteroides sp. HGS0025]